MAKGKGKAPAATSAATPKKDPDRFLKRHTKAMAEKKANPPKVARGTARAKRREKAKACGIKAKDFREVWAKYKLVESGQATVAELIPELPELKAA